MNWSAIGALALGIWSMTLGVRGRVDAEE